MRYYISDLHFFHKGINERMDNRGFKDVEEMNEYMIKRWNSRVRKNDEVVVLGDLSFAKANKTNEILDRLHGKLYLCIGNHDKWIKEKNANLDRFEKIEHYLELNDNGRKVICCHYPIMCYNGQFKKDENGNPKTYMLHGHIHNTQDNIGVEYYKDFIRKFPRQSRSTDAPMPAPINIINCFCMFSNYVPWTLDEWIKFEEEEMLLDRVKNDWCYDNR